MKGKVIGEYGRHRPIPILSFNIQIENEGENMIVFLNTVSNVSTYEPMSRFELGRLTPCEAFMAIDAGGSRGFMFDLNLDWKGLDVIERARTDDVWLDIHIRTLCVEVRDWSPIKFRWPGFHVGKGRHNDKVRIPRSDWLKLRSNLGYGKMRIIEVREETYKQIEEFRGKLKARDLDEAIHEAMIALKEEEKE